MSNSDDYKLLYELATDALKYSMWGSFCSLLELDCMDESLNYEKRYHFAIHEIDELIEALIEFQQGCEEVYLRSTDEN